VTVLLGAIMTCCFSRLLAIPSPIKKTCPTSGERVRYSRCTEDEKLRDTGVGPFIGGKLLASRKTPRRQPGGAPIIPEIEPNPPEERDNELSPSGPQLTPGTIAGQDATPMFMQPLAETRNIAPDVTGIQGGNVIWKRQREIWQCG